MCDDERMRGYISGHCTGSFYTVDSAANNYTGTQLNCNTALETFSLLIASHVLGQSLSNLACGIYILCSTFVQGLLSIKLVVQSVDFDHLLQHYD